MSSLAAPGLIDGWRVAGKGPRGARRNGAHAQRVVGCSGAVFSAGELGFVG